MGVSLVLLVTSWLGPVVVGMGIGPGGPPGSVGFWLSEGLLGSAGLGSGAVWPHWLLGGVFFLCALCLCAVVTAALALLPPGVPSGLSKGILLSPPLLLFRLFSVSPHFILLWALLLLWALAAAARAALFPLRSRTVSCWGVGGLVHWCVGELLIFDAFSTFIRIAVIE